MVTCDVESYCGATIWNHDSTYVDTYCSTLRLLAADLIGWVTVAFVPVLPNYSLLSRRLSFSNNDNPVINTVTSNCAP